MDKELLNSMCKSFSSNENLKNEILSFNVGDFYDLFHGNTESKESIADSEECAE